MKLINELIVFFAARPTLNVTPPSRKSGDDLMAEVLNGVYFIAGVAAVIVIVVAGILYVTSNGNPENVKKAKNAIVYAIIGLVIIMAAFAITSFVAGRF